MASTDTEEDNLGFATKNEASFPILSDPSGAMPEAYGVLSERGYARRWTFYIDADGVIARIDRDVNPATAGEDLVRSLEALNVPPAP